MIRVEIHDFQAIEAVVLEVQGFTALVGRSNIGKSAIIRAVKAVLTNAQGVQCVRHGPLCARQLQDTKRCKCKATVRLTGPGYDILWEKGDAESRYTVNGTRYEAVPKGFPEFLRHWFHPVRIGDESVMLQVADQFKPMFLLDASGPAVADVLSDVAKLDCINAALRLVEKDRREALATIKVREKDVARLHANLATYLGLDSTLHQLEEATTKSANIIAQRDRIVHLRDYARRAEEVKQQVNTLAPVRAQHIPVTAHLKDTTIAWERLLWFQRTLAERQAAVDALVPVEAVYVSTPGLEGHLEASSGLLDWLFHLRTIKAAFARLSPVKDAMVLGDEALRERYARLDTLAPLAERLNAVLVTGKRLEAEQKSLEIEEAGLHEDIRAYGACPVCDQPLEIR